MAVVALLLFGSATNDIQSESSVTSFNSISFASAYRLSVRESDKTNADGNE